MKTTKSVGVYIYIVDIQGNKIKRFFFFNINNKLPYFIKSIYTLDAKFFMSSWVLFLCCIGCVFLLAIVVKGL